VPFIQLAGKGNLMAGAGYMASAAVAAVELIAVSPLTYVRDTANARAGMIRADALPHRIYNLSSG